MKTNALLIGLLTIVLGFTLLSCQKNDDEPEKIISTQEVVRDGNVIVEASYRNELRKMYFILVSPNTAVVTRATDFDPQLTNRQYYRKEVIPSEFEHMSQTYTVVGIKENAFLGCNKLTSVMMPNTITDIGYNAFYGCVVLDRVVLPDQLEHIRYGAFYNCIQLESIEIPASVKWIDHFVFDGCLSLRTVVCHSTKPPCLLDGCFSRCPLQEIKVPQASVEAYRTSESWKEFADKIVGY